MPKEMEFLAIHSRVVVQHFISHFIKDDTISGLIWIFTPDDH
jgi:hypothetical protein